jgi:hypothetical protein
MTTGGLERVEAEGSSGSSGREWRLLASPKYEDLEHVCNGFVSAMNGSKCPAYPFVA